MPILTVCGSCSVRVRISDDLVGKAIKCPQCGQRVAVPAVKNGAADTRPAPSTAPAAGPDDTVDPAPAPAADANTVSLGPAEPRMRPADDTASDRPRPVVERASKDAATVDEIKASAPGDATVDAPAHSDPSRGSSRESGQPPIPSVPGYEILGELGRGGMGVVYKARHLQLGRVVALKMILAGGHAGAHELARFRTEAESVARLQHPNIVQIHEIGEHAGLPYFSLEFCGGGSLANQVQGTPLPPAQAARMTETLAVAMYAAHKNNVIHRDLKPANVLLTEDGIPKITDFGLAKKLDDAGQTQTGAVMGTPSYMAPEQAGGKAKELSPAADVYALGAILYELLTGRPPFKGPTQLDTIMQVIHNEPVPPSQLQPKVPRDLETICLKCLEKAPGSRYDSAQALADDLRRYQTGEPISARPVGLAERVWRWCGRNRAAAALIGSLFLGVIGSVVATGLVMAKSAETEEANQKLSSAMNAETAAHLEAVAEGKRKEEALKQKEDALALEAKSRLEAQKEKREALEKLLKFNCSLHDMLINQAHDCLLSNDLAGCRKALDQTRWDLRGPEYSYVLNRLQRKSRTMIGHVLGVTSLALSADGKRLFSGSWDDSIKAWDLETGTATLTLIGHGSTVSSLALSADGKQLFSGSHDKTIKVWDTVEGVETRTFTGHTDDVASLALSADGQRLCSGSKNGAIKVWDVATGKEVVTLLGHTETVTCLALSPDGKRLYSGGDDSTLRMWDLEKGKESFTLLRVDLGGIRSLALTADGKRLFCGSGDRTIRMWEVEAGKETLNLSGHTDPVASLALSPDGRRLCSAAVGGPLEPTQIIVWDLVTGKEMINVRCDGVTALALAADGNRLYSAGHDRTIDEWDLHDLATSTDTLTLFGHERSVLSVAFLADGKRLISGSEDNSIKVWDLEAGKELLTLRGHTRVVKCLALSTDGKRLFSGSWDKTIREWDLEKGKETRILSGHTQEVNCLALAADGSRLYSGGGDLADRIAELKAWDLQTGKEVVSIRGGHTAGITALALSPDGKRLYTGAEDKTIKVWDLELLRNESKELFTLRGHNHIVSNIIVSEDGKQLYSSSWDRTIKVWDTETRKPTATFFGHLTKIYGLALAPGGKRLYSASEDDTIKVWDLDAGKEALTVRGHQKLSCLALAPDGKRLCTGSFMRTVKVLDLDAALVPRTLHGHEREVYSLVPSADGGRLYSGGLDNTIKVWNLQAGKELVTLYGHTDTVRILAGVADGKRLCSTGNDKSIKIWDLESGTITHSLTGHTGAVTGLAPAPDGTRLFSSSYDKTIKVWDLDSGKELGAMLGEAGYVTCLVISADGKRLCSGNTDGTIKVWDPASHKEALTLSGHTKVIICLAISADGKRLFSAGDDQTIKIWDLETGKEVLTVSGLGAAPRCLALSPDGKRLFSGGRDLAITVWDVDSGKEIHRLRGHTSSVASLACSADGKRLMSASSDRTIKVWDLEAEFHAAANTVQTVSGVERSVNGWIKENRVSYRDGAAEPKHLPGNQHLVELKSGESYRIGFETEKVDGFIVIKDRDDRQMAGPDTQLTVEVPMDGIYKVCMLSRNGTGWYGLKLQQLEPKDAAGYVKRGSHLSGRNVLTESVAALARAIELDPKSANAHAHLGMVLYRQKKFSEAIATFEKSIDLEPKNAAVHRAVLIRAYINLADWKLGVGALPEAIDLLGKANRLLPDNKSIIDREQLLKSMQVLHKRLPDILEEKKKASLVDVLRLAEICSTYQNEHAVSARLYARVIESQPAWPEIWKRRARYLAARSAALAIAGQSKEAGMLTDGDRAKLRQQANGWLRAELSEIAKRLEGAEGNLIWDLEQRLSNWHANADLAILRDTDALSRLPQEEARDWQNLWHETDVLLQQVRGRMKITVSTGALTTLKKSRVHEHKVRAGHAYVVDLESAQFDTFLKAGEQNGQIVAQNDDISIDTTNSRIFLATKNNGIIRLIVSSSEDAGTGSYVLTVREFKNVADKTKLAPPVPKEIIHPGEPLEVEGGLSLKGKLGIEGTSIIYKVKLTGGRNYVIDMISPDSKALDPYLFLLDAAGDKLAEDDDGGEGLNARITYRVVRTGVFQIRATSFQNAGRGPFTLTVREQK